MTSPAIQTCKRCLYTTAHPLGLVLDEEGICSGCRVHEEKDWLDWDERWERLEQLVKPYRSRDSRNYDCIVPVTGAGDSFFIVHVVKERLGLKPLLVTYNRYYNTPLGIRNLAQLRRRFDCDILIQSVNPRSVKKIIRTTMRELGSFHWPVLAGQSVLPVQTAINHKIPLIIWGAHQGIEQVGMFSHNHEAEMTRRYRKDHDLMGSEADDLLSLFDTLSEAEIWQYRYPDEGTIERIGIRGIYLSNYIRWDPLQQHLLMTKHADYKSARAARTFDIYDHIDDWHYLNCHDLLKVAKHGYGKVLDHATREIRHGRITREQAACLVMKHQYQPAQHLDLLTEWLELPLESFFLTLRKTAQTRNEHNPTNKQEESLNDHSPLQSLLKPNSTLMSTRDQTKRHIVIGKGYPS